MNYRELLKKYMRHVHNEEGRTLVAMILPEHGFSEKETEELRVIDREVVGRGVPKGA